MMLIFYVEIYIIIVELKKFLPIIYVVLIMYSKAREKGLEGYVTIIMIGLAIASFAITAMVAISPEWSDIKYDSPVLFYYIKQMLVFWK